MTYVLRRKYKNYLDNEGGIFASDKRRRLLKYSPGRKGHNQPTSGFRYDTRRFVKQALIDLALFIDTAEKRDFNKAFNVDTLNFLVEELFWNPILREEKADPNRAQIAELFISYGYNYLKSNTPDQLSRSEIDTISRAMSYSAHLTRSIGSSNRHLFPFKID